jgi:hypothetical protein
LFARSCNSTSLVFFPSAGYRVIEMNRPSGLNAKALTSLTEIVVPVTRLRASNELCTGFLSFVSRSRSLGGTPIAYATQRLSGENTAPVP